MKKTEKGNQRTKDKSQECGDTEIKGRRSKKEARTPNSFSCFIGWCWGLNELGKVEAFSQR